VVASLLNAFAKTEEDFLRLSIEAKEFSGACANVVLIYRDSIYVANLGDCRCVLGRMKGRGIGLSRDHKASVEKSRIRKVGGFIKNGRVNGVLAISRTIGDREFKDPVPQSPGPANGSGRAAASPSVISSRPGHTSSKSTPVQSAAQSQLARRISSPNTILLKNVRDTAESPVRTRHRNSPALAPIPVLAKSNDTIKLTSDKDSATSTSRDSSPIPFTAAFKEQTPASKSKKRSSLGRNGNGNHAESEASDSATSALSSESAPSKAKGDSSTASPNASPPPQRSPDSESPSPDQNTKRRQSTGSPSSASPSSNSESDEDADGDGDVVEGMYDVIECYDAESKQRKFGFKKRRPPKDPKYDTATVVSAIPEITIMRRSNDDDWIFLASDGFFDLFTSKQTGTAVYKHLQRSGRDNISTAVKHLCEEASILGSEDDITGILILMKPNQPPTTASTTSSASSTAANGSAPSPANSPPESTKASKGAPSPSKTPPPKTD